MIRSGTDAGRRLMPRKRDRSIPGCNRRLRRAGRMLRFVGVLGCNRMLNPPFDVPLGCFNFVGVRGCNRMLNPPFDVPPGCFRFVGVLGCDRMLILLFSFSIAVTSALGH